MMHFENIGSMRMGDMSHVNNVVSMSVNYLPLHSPFPSSDHVWMKSKFVQA